LPGRVNVVISSSEEMRENLKKNGTSPALNLRDALSICEQLGSKEVWVMGGAQIYAQALPLAHRAVITQIDAEFEGDAFAPELGTDWQLMERETHEAANGLKIAFVTYQHAK
jgi:dihydrofolate reductase